MTGGDSWERRLLKLIEPIAQATCLRTSWLRGPRHQNAGCAHLVLVPMVCPLRAACLSEGSARGPPCRSGPGPEPHDSGFLPLGLTWLTKKMQQGRTAFGRTGLRLRGTGRSLPGWPSPGEPCRPVAATSSRVSRWPVVLCEAAPVDKPDAMETARGEHVPDAPLAPDRAAEVTSDGEQRPCPNPCWRPGWAAGGRQ